MAAKKSSCQSSLLKFYAKTSKDVPASNSNIDGNTGLASSVAASTTNIEELGSSQPPLVEPPTDEGNLVVLKQGKHAISFQESWCKDRSWLFYDSQKLGMFCTLCKKYNKRPFDRTVWNTNPCKRIRLESVRDHEKSEAHQDSINLEAHCKLALPASEMMLLQQHVSRSAMKQAFASLYYLCKHRIPHTTNFETLLDLLSFLGLNVKSEIRIGRNASYCSQRSIQEMLSCLSSVVEDDILMQLKESGHYSLMFDETTDCSTIEQLVIHCRYIYKGALKVKFLGMIDVLGDSSVLQNKNLIVSLNADNISRSVTEFMRKKGLSFVALRGIATDGAPVMIGKRNGAVKKIIDLQKEETSQNTCEAIGVHCAAHKLNLAASQAGNSIPYIAKFKAVLRQLYDFYANSSVRTAGLKAIQNILETGEGGEKIVQPSTTRWLSVGGACKSVKENFPAILMSLSREAEERHDVKAAGLHKFICEYKFVATLVMFCDILPHLDRLSKAMQLKSLQVAILKDLISSTTKALETQKQVNSKSANETFCEHVTSCTGVAFNITAENSEWFSRMKTNFIEALLQNIRERFQDHTVLMHFQVLFDYSKYPEILEGTGDIIAEALKMLCTRVGKTYSEEMLSEWMGFAHFAVESDTMKIKTTTTTDFLCTIIQDLGELFPTVFFMASVYWVLPPHTADCERDFSALKLIKTCLRNRLKEESLDFLLRLACEGPELEEYPFDRAIEKWASIKNRRLKV